MKDNQPIVSVCCITFNHEQYIKDALDGFVMQKTDFVFEIVISDDCSFDNTRNIIDEYKLRFPKLIRDVSPAKNKGIIENWKHVHLEARGEYIAFCEGDDYWTDPFKLQKQVEYMRRNPQCGLCITDFTCQTDCDKDSITFPVFASKSTFQPQSFLEHLQNAGYIGPMTWLYKRELFLHNIEDYINITDATLAIALDLFKISEVAYLPDRTAVYRVHNNSAANPSSMNKKLEYIIGVHDTQLFYARKYECSADVIDNLKIQNYTTTIPFALECNNSEYIDEAIRFYTTKGLNMKWYVESCKDYVRYKKQYNTILSSRAYRLGKFLLKPFSMLRKMIKK